MIRFFNKSKCKIFIGFSLFYFHTILLAGFIEDLMKCMRFDPQIESRLYDPLRSTKSIVLNTSLNTMRCWPDARSGGVRGRQYTKKSKINSKITSIITRSKVRERSGYVLRFIGLGIFLVNVSMY